MIYIKKLLKICHFQKNQVYLQILLLLKNIGYHVFKVILGIFHSLNWFWTFKLYILEYIENNIM